MAAITPEKFIGSHVKYDRDGQYFWAVDEKGGMQMLAELRGWGAIQGLFRIPPPNGRIDMEAAGKFQDELGEWIADAINKKLERSKIKQDIWRVMHCPHPEDQRSTYHDNSIICKKCNCVIEQLGHKIDPPTQL